MVTAKCPACRGAVEVQPQPELWLRLTCPSCSASVEIIWLYPVELDIVEAAAEPPAAAAISVPANLLKPAQS